MFTNCLGQGYLQTVWHRGYLEIGTRNSYRLFGNRAYIQTV